MLINLISNAIKYSPPGGEVGISGRSTKGGDCEVAVTDEGPGLPDVQQAAVFERFYQVGGINQKQGSGLGLAICKAIIEKHGGTIGVDNLTTQGSRFWFRIPNTTGDIVNAVGTDPIRPAL